MNGPSIVGGWAQLAALRLECAAVPWATWGRRAPAPQVVHILTHIHGYLYSYA
jgi:hypothetical protein